MSEILPRFVDAEDLRHDGVLAFTSARAVDRYCETAAAHHFEIGAPRCFAVGAATREALHRRGLPAEMPPRPGGGATLAEAIAAATPRPTRVVFPCAEDRHGDLERHLREADIEVEALPLYRTLVQEGLTVPNSDAVVFTSPSAVHAALAGTPTDARVIALGATTADALTKAGRPADAVAEQPDEAALVRALAPSHP